jgi:hypothetical protein
MYPPVTFPLLGINFLLSTLFSKILKREEMNRNKNNEETEGKVECGKYHALGNYS